MLRRFDPRRYPGPEVAGAHFDSSGVALRFLGTAGFTLEGADTSLAIDPFVSRPSLMQTALRPLRPNAALIQREIPSCDAVLVGHAHHDHVLDAPTLCAQTGAVLVGGPAVANVGRAAGLDEHQIRTTQGREDIEVKDARIRGIPSVHGRVYFNRVSLAGDIPSPPPWPPRFYDLRHGLVLNWHIQLGGRTVMHIDSADFLEDEVVGHTADVLCLCAIGRRYRPNLVADAVRLVQPKIVVACHWDWFFTPLDQPALELPGVDLPGFIREVEAAGAVAIVPNIGATIAL